MTFIICLIILYLVYKVFIDKKFKNSHKRFVQNTNEQIDKINKAIKNNTENPKQEETPKGDIFEFVTVFSSSRLKQVNKKFVDSVKNLDYSPSRAYAIWYPEEDCVLKYYFYTLKKTPTEIAKEFLRTENAIIKRLKYLDGK